MESNTLQGLTSVQQKGADRINAHNNNYTAYHYRDPFNLVKLFFAEVLQLF